MTEGQTDKAFYLLDLGGVDRSGGIVVGRSGATSKSIDQLLNELQLRHEVVEMGMLKRKAKEIILNRQV